VRLGDAKHGRETKAGALVRAGGLGGEVRLEHAFAQCGGNARTVVTDLEDHAVALCAGTNEDTTAAAFAKRIARVDDEIHHDLFELRLVADDHAAIRRIDHERDIDAGHRAPQQVAHRGNDVVDRDRHRPMDAAAREPE